MDSPLLTTYEAIAHGQADAHVDPDRLAGAIPVQEEYLFNERFGWDFYEVLRADRIRYALRTAGQPAIEVDGTHRYFYYDPTVVSYLTGDYVLYRDTVFQAIRAVDSPHIEPANIDYFRPAPKFSKPCLETLWTRYLRSILATATVRACVTGSTFQITSRGGVKQYEEGKSKSLTTGEIASLKSELSDINEQAIANMERFVRRSTGDCYALYGRRLPAGDACGNLAPDLITSDRSPGIGRRRNHGFSL